jgi:hypothetical protein
MTGFLAHRIGIAPRTLRRHSPLDTIATSNKIEHLQGHEWQMSNSCTQGAFAKALAFGSLASSAHFFYETMQIVKR